MLIEKIYNNNAVETRDKDNREIVVVGCGLAFKKRVGRASPHSTGAATETLGRTSDL